MDLDWNDSDWTNRKEQLRSKVESIRHSLEGRNTRLALVLIQSSAPLPPGEDILAAERATQLCQLCDLSPKSLFVLPQTDHLFGYILRLEHAFHELAQSYYQSEVRRVKSKKELLSKATHQSLLIRYQFKLAILNELRQDSHTALRHYKLAYQHLSESQFPEIQWNQWKTVAGLLNYKICSLCFQHNTPLDSICHFRRHLELFRCLVGSDPSPLLAAAQHHSFLSLQLSSFASLFESAIEKGLAPVQIEHPGFYYQAAAKEAKKQQQIINQLKDTIDIGNRQITHTDKVEFFGQRWWRVGLASCQKASESLEREGLESLSHLYGSLDLSAPILGWLNLAQSQFRKYKCPRMKRYVHVQLADQYLAAGQYSKSLQLYTQLIWDYRREKWFKVVVPLLLNALKCAYCLANVKEYVTIALQLLYLDKMPQNDPQRIGRNLINLFGGTAPDPEPDLPQNAVLDGRQMWETNINERSFFLIQMHHIFGCVQCRAWFKSGAVGSHQSVRLFVAVRLLCRENIKFDKLAVCLNPGDYDGLLVKNNDLETGPGDIKMFTFDFVPKPEHVGKTIEISSVSLSVGNKDSPIYGSLHWDGNGTKSVYPISPEFALSTPLVTVFDKRHVQSNVSILPRQAQAKITVDKEIGVLLNETYNVNLSIENLEQEQMENITLSVRSPESGFVVLANEEKQFSSVINLQLDKLKCKDTHQFSFVCCATEAGNHSIELELSYKINSKVNEENISCLCSSQQSISLQASKAFEFNSRLVAINGQTVDTFVCEEKVLFVANIKSVSQTELNLKNLQWKLEPHLEAIEQNMTVVAPDVVLKPGECYSLLLPVRCTVAHKEPISAGHVEVTWSRCGVSSRVHSSLWLVSIPSVCVPLLVTYKSVSLATLRAPLYITYTIRNTTHSLIELQCSLEPTDAFMFSGLKQLSVRLLPLLSTELMYVLLPLIAGHVSLPKLKLSGAALTNDHNKYIQRSVATHAFVLPFGKKLPEVIDTTNAKVIENV